MVKYSVNVLDATFAALADPTRRAIVERLARGEHTVTELADPFDMSLPAISKHVRVLETAGLLTRAIDGRVHRCGLNANPLKDAGEWIATYRRFWEKRLDALADFLESSQPQEDTSWPPRPHSPILRSGSKGRLRRPGKKSSRPGPTPRR